MTTFFHIWRFALILSHHSSAAHFTSEITVQNQPQHALIHRIKSLSHHTSEHSSPVSCWLSASLSVRQHVLTVTPWFSASDAPPGSYEDILWSVTKFTDFLHFICFFLLTINWFSGFLQLRFQPWPQRRPCGAQTYIWRIQQLHLFWETSSL